MLNTPKEWLGYNQQPTLPVACFYCNQGEINYPRELVYQFDLWLLDKSGVEGEYELDVISDMHSIANDIINTLRMDSMMSIDTKVIFNAISEKYEDYLSGVFVQFNISVTGQFSMCDFPT